jgi:CheY-like chemotaxis protein
VDSDERNREGTALRFELMDLEVFQASDAVEALRHMEAMDLDLVVTDWPLSSQARSDEFFQKLLTGRMPVVFYATALPGEKPAELPENRPHAHVQKKNRKDLMDQVSRFLEGLEPLAPGEEGEANRNLKKETRQFLVIEDSPTLRGILRRALEKEYPGDIVREAGDGKEALAEMTRKKVDMIITDLEMPGMDGHTFLQHLKNNPILSKKPILIYSGKITEELKTMISDLPRVIILPKPSSPARVLEAVGELLSLGKNEVCRR